MNKEILALMLALAAAAPAVAAPWGGVQRPPVMRPQRPPYPPQQAMPWRQPAPDRRVERSDRRPFGSTMTEQERQALRRDVDKASRDLYRRRR